jgi:hypothetical protein
MNKKSYFIPVQKYKDKILTSYLYRMSIHSELLKTIKSVLPAPLSSHAIHCITSDRKVILFTDSAIWSSQLRFHHQAILRAILKAKQGDFEMMKIKIIPETIQSNKVVTSIVPSTENIESIISQAKNQNDEELKDALLKLGKTLKKKRRVK